MEKNLAKFDDKKRANIFEKQFVSVFTKEPNDEVSVLNKKSEANLSNIYVTDDTVRKEIVKLNLDKSYRPDDTHPYILIE